MSIAFLHSRGTELPIKIPAIGLDLFVRMPPVASAGEFCLIETLNAPGMGPPRHRHHEAEIFRVIEGRYLYEADGRRFYAEAGDVVSIPGGVEHGFVNVTDKPARQYILIAPALDLRRSSPSSPQRCGTESRTRPRSMLSGRSGTSSSSGRR